MWPECISIGAVSKAEGLHMAVFSSSNPEVDYASIGVNIVSLKPGSGYPEMSGTSMAAPHVVSLIRKSQVQGKCYVLHLEELMDH